MIQKDARTRFSYLFPRRPELLLRGDPLAHAAITVSLFLFCSAQTLLWQKELARLLLFFVVCFATLYGLGFSYPQGVRLRFPKRSRLDPHRLLSLAQATDRTPRFQTLASKRHHLEVGKNEFPVCAAQLPRHYDTTCLRLKRNVVGRVSSF